MIPYKDLSPSRRFPIVTVLLIAANTTFFLYEVLLPEPFASRFIYQFSVVPRTFNPGRAFTILSALFLHGGWFHLVGNMLYLWIFGDNVEEKMGRIRFLLFYLLCGILATLAQIYATRNSDLPSLGASGAIAGVLAAYLRLFPEARIAVLVPIFFFLRVVVLPAWLVLGFWVLLQVVQIQFVHTASGETGGIAYFAHVGGFVTGFLFMPLFARRRKR